MEKINVQGLSEDELVTVNLLAEKLRKHTTRNALRSSYYDGRNAVKAVGTVIPPQYRNIGLCLGWSAKAVDGLARRCNIDKFIAADGMDLDSLGMRELEDSNFLLSELSQARTDSLIHGTSFLITTRGEAGEPRALVHAKDALNGTGEWNNRTRRLDNFLSVTSRERNKITGFVLYLENETISADKVDGKWQVDRSEHTFGVPVEPLLYRPRSSRRMGRSRLSAAVMGIQDSALRSLIRLEAHMDIYAIPKLILLGADESIFKNSDGSPKTSWQVVFGRVFGIPDSEDADNPRADVKQFAAESPEPHLKALNTQAKLMARETDLPDADFALMDMANPTSAESYSASRENLIAESEGAMDDWDVGIRRTVTRALAIQNGLDEVPESWSGVQPKWRSPIYLSRAAAADAGAKILGADESLKGTEVGYELLGLDEQQIKRVMAEKRRQSGRMVVEAVLRGNSTAVASSADPAQ